jgi:hypothetical protein
MSLAAAQKIHKKHTQNLCMCVCAARDFFSKRLRSTSFFSLSYEERFLSKHTIILYYIILLLYHWANQLAGWVGQLAGLQKGEIR